MITILDDCWICNLDRTKLISNIIKIKTYFDKNKIDENELEILLRSRY